MIDVADFHHRACAWLDEHADTAPPDYGAIVPPDLVERAIEWHRTIHAAGFAGIHWPVEHGGRGLTVAHTAAWNTECARRRVPSAFNMVGLVLAGGAIMSFGTDDQKSQHLSATLDGDHLWCQLFSEPGSGSDLASLTTRAESDDDGFIVNGQKVWCSGSRYSDHGILLARTGPPEAASTTDARHGISFFLCPMDLPGIERRPLRQMTGEAEFDEVFFTDVRLEQDHLLGPLHGGWGVAMSVLTNERTHIGSAAAAIGRRIDDLVTSTAGAELSEPERDSLAATVATTSVYRHLARRQGPDASTAASLLKLGITQSTFDHAMTAGRLAGAEGILDGDVASGMLSAPGGRIAGGSSEVQRNIIGERLLGLPREPRAGTVTDSATQ